MRAVVIHPTATAISHSLQIDGRDLWPYLKTGTAIPAPLSEVKFSFAAGPGFLAPGTGGTVNPDGSYHEAVIATYEGREYKLCRNCANVRAVSL